MGKDIQPLHLTTFVELAIEGRLNPDSGPNLAILIARSLAAYCAQKPEERISVLHEMLGALGALRTQKNIAVEESVTDKLTGLRNRRFFQKSLDDLYNASAIAKRTPSGRHFLLMIDLDHFKPLNDTYGHAAGDLALQNLSETLTKLVRKTDIVCRIGGDEFAIVLKDATEHGAHTKIAHIARALREMFFDYQDRRIFFQGTVGYAEINPSAIRTMEEILHDADKNLYENKETRRSISTSQDSLTERRPEPVH